jgi:hypothetical protein
MRITLWVLGLVALATVAALAGGQSGNNDVASKLPRPSAAFCKAAGKYDDTVTSRKISLAKHEQMTHAIAISAPKDTAADATLVWKSFVKLQRGDRSSVDNPEVKSALDHVLRRAGQDCGWYRRQDGM